MIIKLKDGIFHGSINEPIMLILTAEEKQAIANMKPEESMISMYPPNSGYTPELIQAWMQEGLKGESNDGPNKV